jgi:VCBS repeat-containing protein
VRKKIFIIFFALLIIISTVPVNFVGASTETMTISPTKDKFVDNTGGYSSWTSGSSAWLYVGYDTTYGTEKSAICFDVSSVPDNVESVTLNLPMYFVYNSALFQLYGSNDDSWSSTGTALPSADTLISEQTLADYNAGAGDITSVDVTQFVTNQKSGDGTASFLLQGNASGSSSYFSFYAMENSGVKPYLSVTYKQAGATISTSTQLTEDNLDSTAVTVTLDDDTFNTSSLSSSDFNVSSGNVSVDNVTYNSSTSCTLRLKNNVGDFDSNISFSLTINSSVLTSNTSLTTSNSLTIQAVNDSEGITATTDGEILRGSEDGEKITISLLGGVFSDTLNNTNWSLYNFPAGVSIGSVTRVNDTSAIITLSGNSTDGDNATITDAYISCSGNEYTEGTSTLYTNDIEIAVINVEPPSIVTNIGGTVDEDLEIVISSDMLLATDSDTADCELVYTITTASENGYIESTDNTGTSITSFTQQDINDGKIRYVHDGGETVTDSFGFTISDGIHSVTDQTFSIVVTPVNDTPVIVNNTGLTVNEGATTTITNTMLSASDEESDDSTLEYTITTVPENGYIENTDSIGTAITSFTQQNIDDGKIRYVHDGSETTTDSFVYKISDGGAELTGQIFAITLSPVNDTPVIISNTGLRVNEEETITITNNMLSASDEESDDSTLEYTITTVPENGYIENTDSIGTAITNFTQQDIDDGKIRYVHDGSETTTDSFVFKVSDGTEELTDQTFIITINPSNDTPSIVNNIGATVNEGEEVTFTFDMLSATDTDNPDETLIYTVTGAPANGQLENSDNPGVEITNFTQQNINDGKINYVHSGTETTSDSFVFKVSDSSEELTSQTFSITVNPLNDTPEILANNILTVNENSWAAIAAYFLLATDSDNDDALLEYIITTGLLNGHLENTDHHGVAITAFSQQDILDNKIIYVQDGSNTIEDYFIFVVSDGSAQLINQTFDIEIVPVDDDAPVVANNSGTEVFQGDSVKITIDMLLATDTDTDNSTLIFHINRNPANGQLENSDNPGVAITTFTQEDITDGKIKYIHDDTKTTSDSFEFYVSDGINNSAVQTFDFTVNLNHPPVRKLGVLADKIIKMKKGEVFTLTLSSIFEDQDGNPLNLLVSVNGGDFVSVTDIYQYTLKADEATLVFKAADGKESSADTYTVKLTVEKEEKQTGSFTITLTDSNGNPLVGLTVELHSVVMTAVTDENGMAVFKNVSLENHELYVFDKNGNEIGQITISMTPSDNNSTLVEGDSIVVYYNDNAVSLDIDLSVNDENTLTVGTITINENPKTAAEELALYIGHQNNSINILSVIVFLVLIILISGTIVAGRIGKR